MYGGNYMDYGDGGDNFIGKCRLGFREDMVFGGLFYLFRSFFISIIIRYCINKIGIIFYIL
jgi:hypothetical protein